MVCINSRDSMYGLATTLDKRNASVMSQRSDGLPRFARFNVKFVRLVIGCWPQVIGTRSGPKKSRESLKECMSHQFDGEETDRIDDSVVFVSSRAPGVASARSLGSTPRDIDQVRLGSPPKFSSSNW